MVKKMKKGSEEKEASNSEIWGIPMTRKQLPISTSMPRSLHAGNPLFFIISVAVADPIISELT